MCAQNACLDSFSETCFLLTNMHTFFRVGRAKRMTTPWCSMPPTFRVGLSVAAVGGCSRWYTWHGQVSGQATRAVAG